MRCKKGDLAVVVKTHAYFDAYLGRIFKCDKRGLSSALREGWKTPWIHADGREIIAPDICVRPIRDNPGQDETLDWAPVPTKETA